MAETRIRRLQFELDEGFASLDWPAFCDRLMLWAKHLAPSSTAKYQFVLTRFGRFLAGRKLSRLSHVTPALVAEYREERSRDVHPTKKQPIGEEGLKADLRILRAAFGWAVKQGYAKKNPVQFPRLNSRSRQTQPFSAQEIARMLESAHPRNLGNLRIDLRTRPDLRAIILTFLTTGFRISDVEGLKKSEVDFAANRILRRTEKTGTDLALALHPELRAELEKPRVQTSAQQESSLLFSTRAGKRMQNLDGTLRALWRRCGIRGGHAHRCRDTFAVSLLLQGATLYDVAKLLGITVAITERHYSPWVKELQERGRKLVEGLTFPSVVSATLHHSSQEPI